MVFMVSTGFPSKHIKHCLRIVCIALCLLHWYSSTLGKTNIGCFCPGYKVLSYTVLKTPSFSNIIFATSILSKSKKERLKDYIQKTYLSIPNLLIPGDGYYKKPIMGASPHTPLRLCPLLLHYSSF